MKKITLTTIFTLLAIAVISQAPQGISHQAVIRDASNQLVTESPIGIQISIIQGTPEGTIVYSETHLPTSNANGLISFIIGQGTVVSGVFAEIDWADGPYFIETKADPTGGTTYTIEGISQMLSVPYALYANTAGLATGTSGRYVGELYGGGVVFWVDHTGQHGLIVSMVDISTSQAWSNITNTLIGTTNDWDGATNTSLVIGQSGHTNSAAQLCADYINDDYGTGVYSDWYLPSVAELNHVWNNFYEVQKALTNDGNPATTPLVRTYYWSSSECNAHTAWYFTFFYGNPSDGYKYSAYYVRAVRAF